MSKYSVNKNCVYVEDELLCTLSDAKGKTSEFLANNLCNILNKSNILEQINSVGSEISGIQQHIDEIDELVRSINDKLDKIE